MFGLGLVAAGLLAVASRVFFVKENPKVEAALEILPGANCGGCGFPGCEGYAKAVVNDPAIPANRCCASPKEAIVALAELTGKVVAEAEPLVSMRRCDIYHGQVATTFEYRGIPSCAAATPLVGNLACVDVERCTGCGACVKACPRGVLELVPKRARVCVPCNSRAKGKAVMEVCEVGCIKCAKCIRTCPAKAIRLKDGIIEVDHSLCLSYGEECGMACVKACARQILRPIDLLNTGHLCKNAPEGSTNPDNEQAVA